LPDFVGTVSLNFCDIDIVQPLEIGNCYHNPNAVNALTALTDTACECFVSSVSISTRYG